MPDCLILIDSEETTAVEGHHSPAPAALGNGWLILCKLWNSCSCVMRTWVRVGGP